MTYQGQKRRRRKEGTHKGGTQYIGIVLRGDESFFMGAVTEYGHKAIHVILASAPQRYLPNVWDR